MFSYRIKNVIDNPYHPVPLPQILCFVTIAMVQDHHEDNHGNEREKRNEKNKGIQAL
jgi:hypothetical protein